MPWPWKKTTPYRELAVAAMNGALAIPLKDEPVFESFSTNTLEAVVALFWMVERSLHGLPREKLELAGSSIMDELLQWFSQDYSSAEVSTLVIPSFERRLEEYAALFQLRQGEQPNAATLRTFKRVVENVFGEKEAHISRITAAILLWWKPISQEGARIVALDKGGKVSWRE